MSTGIFKQTSAVVNGRIVHTRRELTNREVKAYIMKVNNLTSEQYKKKYDIFKNKLRAFEAFEKHAGKKVKAQSPVQILYKQAQAKATAKREGVEYKPSIKMQRIQSFQSISSGKKGQEALTRKGYVEKYSEKYEQATSQAFQAFIDGNPKAKEIAERIKDPVKREQALADYANKLHTKIDEQGKVQEQEAIPFGETLGSNDEIDFDIDAYL